MTARDNAGKAVAEALHTWRYGSEGEAVADEELVRFSLIAVDAIPPNVLAELAIDRGGFNLTNQRGFDDEPLYRVVAS